MSDALNALSLPFATGLLAPPTGRAVFLRAEPGLDKAWPIICEQSFKPSFDALERQGYKVEREVTGDGFDLALCLLTKHKVETLANLGRAWNLLRPGGLVVCAGGNDIGAGSIERTLKAAAGIDGALSKYHCKVFWTTKSGDNATLAAWAEAGRRQVAAETGFWSRPGLYNWNKIDDGSALLVEHLPPDLAGRVADLGAGWGYLSQQLLKRYPAITALDLFEAEWHALEAARANLPGLPATAFHWHDVAAGLLPSSFDTSLAKGAFDAVVTSLAKGAFDAVVMNPPFHSGKATDVDLGRAFIAAAAQGLAPKGRLLLVANRQLPYEAVVAANFRQSRTLVEAGGYKVILGNLPR